MTASSLLRTRPTTDLVAFHESAHQYIISGPCMPPPVYEVYENSRYDNEVEKIISVRNVIHVLLTVAG